MFEIPLFELAGTGLQPTYTAGSTITVGRPQLIRAHAMITTAANSQLGEVVFKWQGTKDPASPNGWSDIASTRDDSGEVELEHVYSAPAGQGASHSFSVDARAYGALRLLARSAGAGQPGDSVTVTGLPW